MSEHKYRDETPHGRYLLFAGYDYYPSGDWDDMRGRFDSIEAATTAANELTKHDYEWAHIVDVETNEETTIR